MVAYATFLLTGESLLSRAIKVSTVKLYLKAVADYFRLHKEFNPTLDAIGAMPRRLGALFHEASRWEQMPNRSEALTPAMVACAFDRGLHCHPDSAIAAFGDWIILGLQAGFRISEYAQSHSSIHMSLNETYATNLNGSSKAFICSDFFSLVLINVLCPQHDATLLVLFISHGDFKRTIKMARSFLSLVTNTI